MEESMEKKEKVTSSNRRNNKPLMEKRRRARINECLTQLKTLVLQALNKDSTQYSKLEKADILEMTVKHLKLVQRQNVSAAMATDPNVISKYRAGFNECAGEIARYLDTVNGGSPDLKGRVMNYLSSSMTQFPVIPVYQGSLPPYHMTQMTSHAHMTSQHGFLPQYSQSSGVHQANSNSAFVSSQQDYLKHSQPSLDNSQRLEHIRLPVNIDLHSTSPRRRIPSPCDSDSGLSDSSMSLSHDENGNYTQYNSNQTSYQPSIKVEQDLLTLSGNHNFKQETNYAHAQRKENSPKRHMSFPEERVSPKRHRSCDSFSQSEPVNMAMHHQAPETESMWRPW